MDVESVDKVMLASFLFELGAALLENDIASSLGKEEDAKNPAKSTCAELYPVDPLPGELLGDPVGAKRAGSAGSEASSQDASRMAISEYVTYLAVNTVNTNVPMAGPRTALGKRSATTPAATGPSIQANVPWTNREAMIEATLGANACGRNRIMMLCVAVLCT